MSLDAKRLRIFISSPGDVAQERAVARRVLGRLQGNFGDRLVLEPVLWEQQPLLASATFQSQLARPSECDIVIAVVWSRLGTPLPSDIRRADGSRYGSGTEFEIEDALASARRSGRPRVLLYRKTIESGRWFASPEAALDAMSQYRRLEEFLDRILRDEQDGSFAAAFHPFSNAAGFEELLELHLTRLLGQMAPEIVDGTPRAATSWPYGSPFRGLESFEFEHTSIFFGRTAATAEAVERLQRQTHCGRAFLLLLGMSGSGKSSLAKAGILPMLMQPGVVSESGEWRYCVLTPAEGHGDLIRALVNALCAPTALPVLGAADQLVAELRANPSSAVDRVGAVLRGRPSPANLAVVVDQLEEIFTDPEVTAGERERFVAILDLLARSGQVWIVATLRSDYYPRCVELPVLRALNEAAGQYDVVPPTADEIAQMIRLPAYAVGLRFEQDPRTRIRLDERLRDLMADRPSALPLLEFTLEELYRRRAPDGTLTFAAYSGIGGLEGALAHRAEEVFAAQLPATQAALPRVFEQLAAIGEDDSLVRRRASLAGLPDPESRALIRAFVDARLLVAGLGESGDSIVTVAHEALFLHWPRLADWLKSDREMLRIRQRVAAAAERWVREEHHPEFLLVEGKPLAEALALREAGHLLEPEEERFVNASHARVRRNRAVKRVAVGALALLAIAASVAAVLAVHQANLARREAMTAQRTGDFLVSLFAISDPSQARGEQVTARAILDRGAAKIRAELREEPLVRAELMNTMGTAYSGLGLYESARALIEEGRAERLKRLGPDHPDTLRSQLAHANILFLAANYESALVEFVSAEKTASRIYPDGHIDHVRATLGHAGVLVAKGQAEDAELIYRRAIESLAGLDGDTASAQVSALTGLGTALYFQSRLDEADEEFRKALDLGQPTLGITHPQVAQAISDRGSIAYQKGEYGRADELWRQAWPLFRAIYGEDHPEVATLLNNLGRVALLQRRFVEAERQLVAALGLDRRFKEEEHDDLILPLNSLGLAYMGQGRFAEAEASFSEAVTIARKREHWMHGVVLTNVADLRIRMGALDGTSALINEARKALESAFPPSARDDEGWRFRMLESVEGALLDGLGRHAEAEPLLVGAIEPLIERFGATGLFAADAMDRARAHFEQTNRLDRAPAVLRRGQHATDAPQVRQ